MAINKIEVKMLRSLIGGPGYPKGSTQHLDAETAKKWEEGGLCEIVKGKNSGKQGNSTTNRGAGNTGSGKKSPKS